MCGILGSISDTFSFSKAGLDLLSHRGPDDEGIFTEGNVMFGHRRLSIVDLSSNGHQPMFSVDENYVFIITWKSEMTFSKKAILSAQVLIQKHFYMVFVNMEQLCSKC